MILNNRIFIKKHFINIIRAKILDGYLKLKTQKKNSSLLLHDVTNLTLRQIFLEKKIFQKTNLFTS